MPSNDAPKVQWFEIQEKVFTRWCNDHLAVRGLFINDLKNDLKNGLNLINLVEILSAKSVGKHNKHPTITIQKNENLNIAINFIQAEGIKLVNVGAEDINSGNMRIILGLIWTLILRYEIQAGGDGNDSAANELLEWIRSKIPEYDIKNFTKNWNDGRAICALTNAMKPGLIGDHQSKDPTDNYNNAKQGIDAAEKHLGVDPLVHPEEMIHPKVDKMGMMCYLAQFRNIDPKHQVSDASRCHAYGPGLVEGLVGEAAPFTVVTPDLPEGKLEIKVFGPKDAAAVKCEKNPLDGTYAVEYTPTTPGDYKVHVTVGGEHIPGSIFSVQVLEQESLGGEGKIRVFYSTTSSSTKSRKDRYDLEQLLEAKKVHLRPDFEAWHAVDILDKVDRDAVFRKANTKKLPIVFIDDRYVGDFDTLRDLNEYGKLDELLSMKGVQLVSHEEHLNRLKQGDPSEYKEETAEFSEAPAAPMAQKLEDHLQGPAKFCAGCGAANTGAKFCQECGQKF